MPSYINTNISSLNAQRNLTASQSALQTSLQRLSSGLRINSAKDDAAGLAIANRFSTQISGLNQAQRNANDGISLAQTADGALSSVSDNLQRIRELAVQAANSTNSASDRAAINEEVQQRLQEIDRTSSQTSFNGQKILDGSFGSANFQVGANAGETIKIDLNSSMRTGAIGKIATETTTGAVGATASGGTITTGAITAGNFSTPTAAAVDASISVTPASLLFGGATDSSSAFTLNAANANFSVAGNGLAYGNNSVTFAGVGGVAGTTDFSATLAQFDVNVGAQTVGITLDQNYASVQAVSDAIQSQLQAVDPNYVVTNNAGVFDIHKTGSTVAVSITNSDANATAAGFANSAGSVATTNTSFTVGGHTINLNTDYSLGSAGNDAAQLATDIQTQLQTFDANYTVSQTGGAFTISKTGSSLASDVAVAGTDSVANSAGINDTAGTAGTASGNATFTVDGQAITLDANYANVTALASAVQSKLDTSAGAGVYTATNNNGAVQISKVGDTGAALAISAADAQATSAGFATSVVGTAGSVATTSTALSFAVDGSTITLNGNDATLTDVKTELQSKLDTAFGSGAYTAAVSGTGLSITNAVAGSGAVAISATDANAQAAGFADATGTAGATGGSVAISNLSIKVGDNNAVSITAKTYASVDDLAAEINKSVGGAYATVSNGKLTLSSASALTLSGSDATTLTFASNSVAASSGSLDSGDTLTVDNANNLIQRVDSALGQVNGLRSTFGAIQNRFDSVISNLSSTSENLSAARSRIQDADFAAETASLTRGQILQQAGTAMLAQANSLPNGVLALLR